jgi:hypothetical protein
MKVRAGFVTNSSSSSFILQKKNLTESQIEKVMRHGEYCRIRKMEGQFYCDIHDDWGVCQHTDTITGSTYMNNFDMEEFFKMIGIDSADYKIDCDG